MAASHSEDCMDASEVKKKNALVAKTTKCVCGFYSAAAFVCIVFFFFYETVDIVGGA